jgi:CheY-like chemotaxis protein/HPt (histidine-containing phosphotransfer) domain-containing protein
MDNEYLKNNGIDLEKSLELLGDIETYNDILKEFIDGYNEKISLIKKYKEEQDMPNYAIQVHSLKSNAKYLGMTELAEKAYEHELKSKDNDLDFVNSDYVNLMAVSEKYKNIANEYINGNDDSNKGENNMEEKMVLIADDSNIIRSIAKKMIGDTYKTVEAQDGAEAIKVIENNQDTLIGMLLDLNMPNANGFEVLNYLKTNNLFVKIPVVIITGDDSKETIMNAFDFPIVDVLAKPFNESDITRVLNNMKMNSANNK